MHFCPTTPLILCGLKSDLRNKKTCIELLKTQGLTPVTPQQGQAVAARMGATYMECSAKERIGVDDIFDEAIIQATAESGDYVYEDADGNKTVTKTKRKRTRKACKIL